MKLIKKYSFNFYQFLINQFLFHEEKSLFFQVKTKDDLYHSLNLRKILIEDDGRVLDVIQYMFSLKILFSNRQKFTFLEIKKLYYQIVHTCKQIIYKLSVI